LTNSRLRDLRRFAFAVIMLSWLWPGMVVAVGVVSKGAAQRLRHTGGRFDDRRTLQKRARLKPETQGSRRARAVDHSRGRLSSLESTMTLSVRSTGAVARTRPTRSLRPGYGAVSAAHSDAGFVRHLDRVDREFAHCDLQHSGGDMTKPTATPPLAVLPQLFLLPVQRTPGPYFGEQLAVSRTPDRGVRRLNSCRVSAG
jgi:hypothetical protein